MSICILCNRETEQGIDYEGKIICPICYARIKDYAERLEARIERLRSYAAKVSSAASADYNRAHAMAESIPFGQPILVGHHSEGRDRNYRERIHNTFGRAFAQMERAKELAHKASAAESNHAISSDDPAAVLKLQAKLDAAIMDQEHMKTTNKILRDVLKLPEDQRMIELQKRANVGVMLAAKLLQPDFMGRVGYAQFHLTNNNANIRRMTQRIEELKAQASRAIEQIEPETITDTAIGVTLERDAVENRLRLHFPGKPAADVIAKLKYHGFKWSPSNTAWQRQLNNGAEYAAQCVLDYMKTQQSA